jgi:hypothetical protein
MRVAGQEAVLRRRLLAQSVGRRGPLATLASAFFTQVESVLETPWAMAAIPDFIFSETTGHRPPDLAREFALALTRLAARKPDVRRLMMGVSNLLEPRSVCRSPILMARVLVEMARDDRA